VNVRPSRPAKPQPNKFQTMQPYRRPRASSIGDRSQANARPRISAANPGTKSPSLFPACATATQKGSRQERNPRK
jgi:hypothetical protein